MYWCGKNYWCVLSVGRCFHRLWPCSFFLGLFPRGKPSEWREGYKIPFRFSFEIAWDWPRLYRVFWDGSFAMSEEISSYKWTGRVSEIAGWSWPHTLRVSLG